MGTHSLVGGGRVSFLYGLEVSGVAFVRDYLELMFDGPILRVFSEPDISHGTSSARFPVAPFHELACGLIGRTIVSAQEHEDVLTIEFDDEWTLLVPLASGEAGAEVLHFVPHSSGVLDVQRMTVWENRLSGSN